MVSYFITGNKYINTIVKADENMETQIYNATEETDRGKKERKKSIYNFWFLLCFSNFRLF